MSYAKNLATAPVRALKTAALATWGYITSMYAQFAASVAASGGITAYALSMGTGLLSTLGAATAGVWSFTTALLANPITWVVMAIAALVAGLIILQKEFGILSKALDWIMYGMGYLAGTAMQAGKAIVDAFMVPFRFIGRLIDKVGGIGNAVKELAKIVMAVAFPPLAIAFYWDELKTGIPKMLAWIKGLIPKFLEMGEALFGAFTDGMKSMLKSPLTAVKGGFSKLMNFFPGSDAKEGPLSRLTASGTALMTTVATGMQKGMPSLENAVKAGAATMAAGLVIAAPGPAPMDQLYKQPAPPAKIEAAVPSPGQNWPSKTVQKGRLSRLLLKKTGPKQRTKSICILQISHCRMSRMQTAC